jgi:hypothetical protein
MAPPVPAVVSDMVNVAPEHTAVALGLFVITGPAGTAFTVQLTVLPEAVVHPEPVEVLCDCIMLVPTTAAKLGKLVPHEDQLDPLFVEKRYSSCEDIAPPVPAVVTIIVTVCPAHTSVALGFFAITGPTGTALTVQLTVFPEAVVHPEPVEVLLDSIVLVPVTAVKLGIVVLQAVKPEPISKRYSSCEETAPPVPAVVTVMVTVCPAHTSIAFGLFAITGPAGTVLTITITVPEVTAEQTPLVTTALKYLVAVKAPISAIVKLVELVPILVKLVVNPKSSALSH